MLGTTNRRLSAQESRLRARRESAQRMQGVGPVERTVRKFPILFVMAAAIASPAWAAQRVKSITVFELTQFLSQARGKSDRKVARELSTLRLTQRISSARLTQWYEEFPGKQTRLALTELGDASAFLDLPVSEVSNRAAPDRDVQRLILHSSIQYVNRTTQQLPNFSAVRTTLHF